MKSLFRRGKCNAALGALDEAKADLDCIMAMEVHACIMHVPCMYRAYTMHSPRLQHGYGGTMHSRTHV